MKLVFARNYMFIQGLFFKLYFEGFTPIKMVQKDLTQIEMMLCRNKMQDSRSILIKIFMDLNRLL